MYLENGLGAKAFSNAESTEGIGKDVLDNAVVLNDSPLNQYEGLSEAEQAEHISSFIDSLSETKLENWESLSLQERTNVLQNVENYSAQVEGRQALNVVVTKLPDGTRGYMDWSSGTIAINSSLVTSNNLTDLRQTFTTLSHEGRHAYQWSNLYVQRTELNAEKVDSWRANLENLGYQAADRVGFMRYYTQPVEVDARTFADDVTRNINFR